MTTEEAILRLAECVSRDFGSKAKIFSITVNAETAPLAIVKACLKAKGVDMTRSDLGRGTTP